VRRRAFDFREANVILCFVKNVPCASGEVFLEEGLEAFRSSRTHDIRFDIDSK
jgi:hypothetical protein